MSQKRGLYTAPDFNPYPWVDAPTSYSPGSLEKVEILAARYEVGVPLWRDGDANRLPTREEFAWGVVGGLQQGAFGMEVNFQ